MNTSEHEPTEFDPEIVGRMDLFLKDLKQRGLQCEALVDVGAAHGTWSSLASGIFPEADFTLIEPREEMKAELERFCSEHPKSRYFLAGAGAQAGTLPLTLFEDGDGSSFFPHRDSELQEWVAQNREKQREVEIVTIDDLITKEALPIPDMMKLDVQGFELEVLRGASSTFGKTSVYILEVSFFPFFTGMPTFYEVIDFMKKREYVAYDFPGFLRRPSDGALAQCDVCFVQEDGFLRSSKAW